MAPLDRKLLRDLWRIRLQALAIALVIGCGVATVVMSFSALHSLEETRIAYYERHRFAQIFAPVKRAPESLLARLREIPGVAVLMAPPFGRCGRIVELSARRRDEALRPLPPEDEAATALVMIGRGSSDPGATAQVRAFTDLSVAAGRCRPGRVELGFVAAARPTLEEALAAASGPGVRRVVVQPHLLFHGHVQDQVTAAVDRWRAARPDVEWVQVARLGPDLAVAEALVDLAAEAVLLETRQAASKD